MGTRLSCLMTAPSPGGAFGTARPLPRGERGGYWIPACAGMTRWGPPSVCHSHESGNPVPLTRLRFAPPASPARGEAGWIPAFAGMTHKTPSPGQPTVGRPLSRGRMSPSPGLADANPPSPAVGRGAFKILRSRRRWRGYIGRPVSGYLNFPAGSEPSRRKTARLPRPDARFGFHFRACRATADC